MKIKFFLAEKKKYRVYWDKFAWSNKYAKDDVFFSGYLIVDKYKLKKKVAKY